jgi:predicted NBD/HSP70 family sugar kinase
LSDGQSAGELVPATTPGRLLALLRSRSTWTRHELLEATGMSRPTLLARLSPLLAAGLAYESGPATPTGGRPAQLIRFDDRRLVVLAIDVGHTHATVAVADVHGTELRSARHPIDVFADPPGQVLDPLLAEGMRMAGADRRVAGVGLALPTAIWPGSGLPHPSWTMPLWRDYPVRERVGEAVRAPLVLENDARAIALGEAVSFGAETLLAVKWANGIGAGIVVGGECLAGHDGAAGDIGHIRVSTGTSRPRLCRCGGRGCLAAYASGYALVRALRLGSVENLVARARAGDSRVLRVLNEAGELLGGVLASQIAMLNPGLLVLNGAIGLLPGLADRVERTVRGVALSRSTEHLEVRPSRLGDRAATAGLARLVTNRVLHPDAVDAALI